MHPTICKIGPFTVYSYGLMLALAFLVSSTLAIFQAKKENICPDTIFNLAFIVSIFGVIGARLLYVFGNIAHYMANPLEVIMLHRGGLSWFGGLWLGIISGAVYLKQKKLRSYQILDLVAPYIALGQAIGRIGCLLNGCCFGLAFGFMPAQIASSLMLISIFIILRFLQLKPHQEGKIFFSYLLLYSLKRFFIEFWRQDNEIIFLNLTLFQILSALAFVVALYGLVFIKRPQT